MNHKQLCDVIGKLAELRLEQKGMPTLLRFFGLAAFWREAGEILAAKGEFPAASRACFDTMKVYLKLADLEAAKA